MLHKKCMRVCTTILPLFKDNYPNCVLQGAPQARQDKHPLSPAWDVRAGMTLWPSWHKYSCTHHLH